MGGDLRDLASRPSSAGRGVALSIRRGTCRSPSRGGQPREDSMAHFKEVTLVGGDEKVTINLEKVKAMQRFGAETRIHFAKDHAINVKETPSEILAESLSTIRL